MGLLPRLGAIAFILVIAQPAHAATYNPGEGIPPGAPFQIYLDSDLHGQYRAEMAARENKGVGRQCLAAVTVGDATVTIINPVTMVETNRYPTKGLWIERYEATACGRTRTFNTLFEMQDGGGMTVTPVVPGSSERAFDLLQGLRPYIEENTLIDGCTIKSVLDTNPGLPNGYNAAVMDGDYDTWRVIGCGKQFDVVLLFTSAPDGTIDITIEQQIAVNPAAPAKP